VANIMAILTSEDDEEIIGNLRMLLRGTGGTGLMHESVNSWSVRGARYTGSWFSWANRLFGQCVLDLEDRRGWVLESEFQD